MTVYFHSRLSCYEQCPHKFKLQYIDKVEAEVEESIEAFLGSCVHETLEKLNNDLKFQKENSLRYLISYLHKIWDDNWDESVVLKKQIILTESVMTASSVLLIIRILHLIFKNKQLLRRSL